MPQSITNHYGNIFKALVYLSQRSVEIRQAAAQKKQKGEMAEVEEDGAIAEDDADDMGIDLESDDDDDDEWSEGNDNEDGGHTLYESPLDPVDEILNLHQHLEALQQNGGGLLIRSGGLLIRSGGTAALTTCALYENTLYNDGGGTVTLIETRIPV